MESLRGYIQTITVAAILCAVVTTIIPGKAAGQKVMRMICGFFLLAVLCKPMEGFQFSEGENVLDIYRQEALNIEAQAQNEVDMELSDVIRAQTETYIEDKAGTLGAEIDAVVILDDEMIPCQVELDGEVSPYVKSRLTEQIKSDLGIPAERQVWN